MAKVTKQNSEFLSIFIYINHSLFSSSKERLKRAEEEKDWEQKERRRKMETTNGFLVRCGNKFK